MENSPTRRIAGPSSSRPVSMRNALLKVCAAAGVLAIGVTLLLLYTRTPARAALDTATINEHTWTVELALTTTQQQTGLSGRKGIDDDRGMLFVFPKPEKRTFWAMGCLMPIDVAFIDAQGKITNIHTMQPQPGAANNDLTKYHSDGDPLYALEVGGGVFARKGVKPGDQVTFSPSVLRAAKAVAQSGR